MFSRNHCPAFALNDVNEQMSIGLQWEQFSTSYFPENKLQTNLLHARKKHIPVYYHPTEKQSIDYDYGISFSYNYVTITQYCRNCMYFQNTPEECCGCWAEA